MFKGLITKYAVDYSAKLISVLGTIMVAKGIAPAETVTALTNHLTESAAILIALAVTSGVKALNDNSKVIVDKAIKK